MSLDHSAQNLCTRYLDLRDALLGLRLTVIEDRPQRHTVALVDALGDAVEDMAGRMQEGLIAATETCRTVQPPLDIERARYALTQCQEQYIRIARRFAALVAYEQITELDRLGRERGKQWRAWTDSIRQALESCRAPLCELEQALFCCWQDIAARAGLVAVTVRGGETMPVEAGTSSTTEARAASESTDLLR